MSKIKEVIKCNQQKQYIPHHKNSLSTLLLNEESDDVLSFGVLSYPVIRLPNTENTRFIYKHSDSRFQPESNFAHFIDAKRQELSFNEEYHVRCKSIKFTDDTYILETEWSDFSQFLGTNMMLNSNEALQRKVMDYKWVSPLLSNELAAIGTFIVHDNNKKYLMLTKRGSNVSTYANCMSSSVSGAMGGAEKWIDFDNFLQPNPLLTIIRETKEELGLEIDLKDLRLDGLCMQAIDKQPNFLVSGELFMPREEILQKAQFASDKDEIDEEGIIFIPFTLEELMPYIIYLEYSPTSVAGIWTLLEKYYSKMEIELAISHVLKGEFYGS